MGQIKLEEKTLSVPEANRMVYKSVKSKMKTALLSAGIALVLGSASKYTNKSVSEISAVLSTLCGIYSGLALLRVGEDINGYLKNPKKYLKKDFNITLI